MVANPSAVKSFFCTSYKAWGAEAFLQHVIPVSPDSNPFLFDELMKSYVEALTAISRQEPASKRGSKALHLLLRYNQGKRPDYFAARIFFDASRSQAVGGTTIVKDSIIGTVTGPSHQVNFSITGKRKSEIPGGQSLSVRSSFLLDFEEAYNLIPTDAKSYRHINFVDCLFENAKDLPNELAAHSWIFDCDDSWTTGLFPDNYFDQKMPKALDPPMTTELTASFNGVTTIEDFQRILKSKPPAQGQDSEWVHPVYLKMLLLYKSPNPLLTRINQEGFFSTHIWPYIIDNLFLDLADIALVRTELCSVSFGQYLNRNKSEIFQGGKRQRVLTGPKIDGIFQEFGEDPLEYGAIEVSKCYQGRFSEKWITDRMKLLKILSHMVGRLYWHFCNKGGEPEEAQKIPVVGILCSGYRIQVIEMYTNGYVCFASVVGGDHTGSKNSPSAQKHTLSVPTSPRDLRNLSPVLSYVWKVKQIIARSFRIIHSPLTD